MGSFFQRPDPKQAVPQDLQTLRNNILMLIGSGGDGGYLSQLGGLAGLGGGFSPTLAPAGQRPQGGILGGLNQFGIRLGGGATSALQRQGTNSTQQFTNQPAPQTRTGAAGTGAGVPGGDILGPLGDIFQRNINDQVSQLNSSSPGRFSTANLYEQGQLRQRGLQDFNMLAAQALEHGRDRQLQAIMGLLGPVLGPSFGGPFTQGSSGFENLLGAAQTVAPFIGGGAGGKGGKGGGQGGFMGSLNSPALPPWMFMTPQVPQTNYWDNYWGTRR